MSHNQTEMTRINEITTIDCVITNADVNKMFELYDSGMCDITTQNAAALALKRFIQPHHMVAIHHCGCGAELVCEIDGKQVEVSGDLDGLIKKMEQGISPVGGKFSAKIPCSLFRRQSIQQNEAHVEQVVHSKQVLQSA